MTKTFTVEKIKEFVAGNQLPVVIEFTQESAQKIFGGEIKSHMLYFLSKKVDDFQSRLDEYKKSAPEFKGKVLFIYIDIDVEDNLRILEFFGLKPAECPSVRYIKLGDDMTKYKPETDELDNASITSFAKSVLDGTLKVNISLIRIIIIVYQMYYFMIFIYKPM